MSRYESTTSSVPMTSEAAPLETGLTRCTDQSCRFFAAIQSLKSPQLLESCFAFPPRGFCQLPPFPAHHHLSHHNPALQLSIRKLDFRQHHRDRSACRTIRLGRAINDIRRITVVHSFICSFARITRAALCHHSRLRIARQIESRQVDLSSQLQRTTSNKGYLIGVSKLLGSPGIISAATAHHTQSSGPHQAPNVRDTRIRSSRCREKRGYTSSRCSSMP